MDSFPHATKHRACLARVFVLPAQRHAEKAAALAGGLPAEDDASMLAAVFELARPLLNAVSRSSPRADAQVARGRHHPGRAGPDDARLAVERLRPCVSKSDGRRCGLRQGRARSTRFWDGLRLRRDRHGDAAPQAGNPQAAHLSLARAIARSSTGSASTTRGMQRHCAVGREPRRHRRRQHRRQQGCARPRRRLRRWAWGVRDVATISWSTFPRRTRPGCASCRQQRRSRSCARASRHGSGGWRRGAASADRRQARAESGGGRRR